MKICTLNYCDSDVIFVRAPMAGLKLSLTKP
jgi:hypothetical protein